MPVGIHILNARRTEPNPRIVFIKPLPGSDEAVAREFLERIAAQCVPIMRDHHLSVTTLEEYEPNAEFVGRNFNGGEVVQLVLKARHTGRWLPFGYVQMVMMHELAHCRQMNHSRAFWAVRDAFAAQMRGLWAQYYTGEGMWGRGARLGARGDRGPPVYERNMAQMGDTDGVLLEHLCGGTYRSRGSRSKTAKKAKTPETYRERQERRIQRKFGSKAGAGVALGDDLDERVAAAQQQRELGAGKTVARSTPSAKVLATRPRVAVSKRGRELRAAAALARFDQNKTEDKFEDAAAVRAAIKREKDSERASWSGSSDDDDDDGDDLQELAGPDAIDLDGSRMLDSRGQSMVRVCEGRTADEGGGGGNGGEARRELQEMLQTAQAWGAGNGSTKRPHPGTARAAASLDAWVKPPVETDSAIAATAPVTAAKRSKMAHKGASDADADEDDDVIFVAAVAAVAAEQRFLNGTCPVCSFANDEAVAVCTVCRHVLRLDAVPGAWRCRSVVCRASGTVYVNTGDCSVCGVCGAQQAEDGSHKGPTKVVS